ncbi:MAG TPA: DUF4349 domain-containing protein [Nocardioides sp.]|nr:DUF4349 domain-containing protein [Nocardioides sp.]
MNPRATLPGLALLSVLLAGALVGCSGSGDSSSSGDAGSSGGGAADAIAGDVAAEAPAAPASGRGRAAPGPDVMARAVIRKGNVELRADDVGAAQSQVQKVVNRYFGQVTEEQTSTDDDGRPAYTNLVLRIPTERFGDAMADLKGIADAELVSANSSENDVSTKVIDTRTRLVAQKRSIARITVLFGRAESIRDIMAIEAELSQRQADLDSLERQAAFLHGQTSMSTITVSIDRTPTKAAVKKDEDRSGFLAGLSAGWEALAAFAVGIATILGALLPWLVVVAVLGPPAYLAGRAVRRRISAGRSGRTPSAA